MAQPYVGEIRMFAGNFAPAGWMFCEGQLLPISEYETLFNLIGTTYGGDGESTFALPDLRGRIPIHQGNSFILAETGGAEEITLTVNQIPAHSHPFLASTSVAQDSSPLNKTVGGGRWPDLHSGCDRLQHEPPGDHCGRRQPASHQFSTLSLRRFHHLALRHLPFPDLRSTRWIHS